MSRRSAAVSSSRIRELLRLVDAPGVLSLAGGLPSPSSLDAERVRAAAEVALARPGALGPPALQYGPTEGIDELRDLLAAREAVARDDVIVTTGSQQALDLLARALCDPGDELVVEAPSYLGALQAFAAAGIRVRALPGDAAGFDVDALERDLAAGRTPKAVYVVPDFHNPTGAVLPLDRRVRLVELAARHGFVVIEDDPYGELRFAGEPVPSIASIDRRRVIRLGTASKILAPGLRVGWLTGPRPVLEAVTRLKQAADLHTASLNQLVVATLLADEAGQAAHLDRVRRGYAARSRALDDALTAHLGGQAAWTRPEGGMFTWVRLAEPGGADGPVDTDARLRVALDHGVAFVPGSAFVPEGVDSCRDAMRLSYATLDEASFDEAVRRLAAALSA